MFRKPKTPEHAIESPLEALQELQAQLEEAESELAGYRSVQDIATFELNELRTKVAKLEAEKREGNPAVEDPRLKDLELEVDAQKAEIGELRAKLAAREEAPDAAPRSHQADYFAKQLEVARETIFTLEQELLKQPTISPEDLAELRAQSIEIESLRAQKGVLASEIEDLKQRNDEAEERLLLMRKDRLHSEKELETLRAELDQFMQKSDIERELRDTIADLSAQLTAAQQSVVDVRRETQSQQARSHQALAELDDLRRENSSLTDEMASLREELSRAHDAGTEVQRLEARLAALAADLEAYDDLKQTKEQLQHRAAVLEAELSDAKNQTQAVEDLRAELDLMRSTVADLAHLRAQMASHHEGIQGALEQFDDLVAGLGGPNKLRVDEKTPAKFVA